MTYYGLTGFESLENITEADLKAMYQSRRKQIQLEEGKMNLMRIGEINEEILSNPPKMKFRMMRLKRFCLQLGTKTGW